MGNFSDKISKFAELTEEKMSAVVKDAIQEVVIDAQTPKAKGGSMPVDTGFLRNSGVYSLNQIPKGETTGRERREGEVGVLPEYANPQTGEELNIVLAKMKLKDVFYFGWTALYARKQEVYNGFVLKAVKKWKDFVEAAVRRLK